MSKFEFLQNHIQSLPDDRKGRFLLETEKDKNELTRLEVNEHLVIPQELKEFYEFSYGAILGEYKILTILEISKAINDLRITYGNFWLDNVFPFAYLIGVGDYFAFDLNKSSSDGILVLDGFHELPPTEWKGICFGLETWIKKLVKNNFRPFWLTGIQ